MKYYLRRWVPEATLYKLSPMAFGRMRELNNKSQETGLEHGAMLCTDPQNEIRIGKECVGTECQIFLPYREPNICPPFSKQIGGFHGHPAASAAPSIGDMLNPERRKGDISCIGGFARIRNRPESRQEIICYTLKQPWESYTAIDEGYVKGLDHLAKFERLSAHEQANLDYYHDKLRSRFERQLLFGNPEEAIEGFYGV